MEIDNAIFQDQESSGKGKFLKMAMESFGFLFGKILEYLKMDITVCVVFVHFTIYSVEHNSPKIMKHSIENHVFLFSWGFKMRMKMCFIVWKI